MCLELCDRAHIMNFLISVRYFWARGGGPIIAIELTGITHEIASRDEENYFIMISSSKSAFRGVFSSLLYVLCSWNFSMVLKLDCLWITMYVILHRHPVNLTLAVPTICCQIRHWNLFAGRFTKRVRAMNYIPWCARH